MNSNIIIQKIYTLVLKNGIKIKALDDGFELDEVGMDGLKTYFVDKCFGDVFVRKFSGIRKLAEYHYCSSGKYRRYIVWHLNGLLSSDLSYKAIDNALRLHGRCLEINNRGDVDADDIYRNGVCLTQ